MDDSSGERASDLTPDQQQVIDRLKETDLYYSICYQSPASIGLAPADRWEPVDVNNGFERIFGYAREEAIGRTLDDLNIIVDEELGNILRRLEEKPVIPWTETKVRRVRGRILDMNPAGLEMLGYSREVLDELNASEIFPDTGPTGGGAKVIEKKQEVDNMEVTLRRKDGEEIVCLLSSTARKDEIGQTEHYFTIFRDITERKQYQDQFCLLVEEVKDYAIFMIDREGHIVNLE